MPCGERVFQQPARLDALASFEMLDTPREQDFDEIADLASRICETPIAVVNLVGEGRQFFKAEVGLSNGAQYCPPIGVRPLRRTV